jgi:hypothetical protein
MISLAARCYAYQVCQYLALTPFCFSFLLFFGKEKTLAALYRVTSLPLGVPVELEIIFEVAN